MVLFVRLVFVALVPLGVFVLVKAIKLIRATFFGDIVAEAKLSQEQADLLLPVEGLYAIWLKGGRLQVPAVQSLRPAIWEKTTKVLVQLDPTVGLVRAHGSEGYRVQLFTFSAPAGSYTLDMGELPAAGKSSGALASLFSSNASDPSTLVAQVRATKPFYYGVLGILLCVVSGFLLLGGIIGSILADKIVNGQH
jgi:hypothetical protein